MEVGFIGLGNIGGPCAKHLLDAGHRVTVFDIQGDLFEQCRRAGVDYLDCPVSGGAWAAERGDLALMPSGDESAFDRMREGPGPAGNGNPMTVQLRIPDLSSYETFVNGLPHDAFVHDIGATGEPTYTRTNRLSGLRTLPVAFTDAGRVHA